MEKEKNLVALVQTFREKDERAFGRLGVGSEAKSSRSGDPERLRQMKGKIAEKQGKAAKEAFHRMLNH